MTRISLCALRKQTPERVVAVKALACQRPYESEVPLSRCRVPEIRREVIERGLVASIGESTLWRWLSEEAIRPWSHRVPAQGAHAQLLPLPD